MKLPVILLSCGVVLPVLANEGLWPYNQFPITTIKQEYSFDVPPDFLEHLQLSSVKIGKGSAAFVSPNGLLLTSRQIVAPCLEALNTPQHDYLRDGFPAGPVAEKACPGLEARVLLKIEDVSEPVKAAGTSLAQRNAAIAKLEKECSAKSGNICSVVQLFSGGRYDLYQYRRYSDVRLVFAPEYTIAFFGKERDSISYLRYGLTIAFLRAYQNGKPANTPNYLKWSTEVVKEGALVFLAGNPGPTGRLSTSAQLSFYRDTALPVSLARLEPRLKQLNTFAAASEENLRAAQPTLAAMLTVYKNEAGRLIGLRDDRLSVRKAAFEGKMRRTVEGNAKLGAEAGRVWDEVAAAYRKWAPTEKPFQILEESPAPGSALFRMARQILRGETVDESAGISDAVETMMLAQYLTELQSLGEKEIALKTILAGATPQQAAEKMVKGTQLKNPAGRNTATRSNDPILALAAAIEGPVQKLRKEHDDIIGKLEVSATEKIAQYRLKLFGAAEYPDGTSTPRVQFGAVKGYTDRAAVAQPFASTFSGLYYRRDNEGPWQVSQQWIDVRPLLDPVVPLDFVSTCDIGGGDYGSPVVNQKGELVGITFGGNLESLPITYLYSDEQARAVHVDAQGIIEALEKVYKAADLLKELGVERHGPVAP